MSVKKHPLAGAKEGKIFALEVAQNLYGYVRIYRGSSLGLLPVTTEHLLESVEALRGIEAKWFFFFAAPPDDATQMFPLGNISFDHPEEAEPPPCYDPPDAFQGYYRIYQHGMFRRAEQAEVGNLERCKGTSPAKLRDFILSNISQFHSLTKRKK